MDGVFYTLIPYARECTMTSEDTPMSDDPGTRMNNARLAMSEVILRVREDEKKHVREPQTLHELRANLVFQERGESRQTTAKSGKSSGS